MRAFDKILNKASFLLINFQAESAWISRSSLQAEQTEIESDFPIESIVFQVFVFK